MVMVMSAFGGMAVGSNARFGRMVYRIPSPPEWVQTLHYEPAESNTYTKLAQEYQAPLRGHMLSAQRTHDTKRNDFPVGVLRSTPQPSNFGSPISEARARPWIQGVLLILSAGCRSGGGVGGLSGAAFTK